MLDSQNPLATVRIYLGGTFNPIHIGHARLLLDCQTKLNAAQASFVPSAIPPHKPEPELSLEHRVLLGQKVVDELNDLPGKAGVFAIEMCELERDGPSYTVDTLEYLRGKFVGDCLIWVIGMDSLVNLESWNRWQELVRCANILVINRPGWELPTQGPVSDWIQLHRCSLEALPLFGGIAFFDSMPLDISSTDIRERLTQGLPAKYLLPEPVLNFIEEHGNYYTT